MSHSDAEILRSGNFCANNDRQQTKSIILLLVHVSGAIMLNYCIAGNFQGRKISQIGRKLLLENNLYTCWVHLVCDYPY